LSTSSGKVLLIRILNSFSPTYLPVISASLIQTLIRTCRKLWCCLSQYCYYGNSCAFILACAFC